MSRSFTPWAWGLCSGVSTRWDEGPEKTVVRGPGSEQPVVRGPGPEKTSWSGARGPGREKAGDGAFDNMGRLSMLRPIVLLILSANPLLVVAADSGPNLGVDVAASRHAISPDIYGINDYGDSGLARSMRIPVNRWGGDAATRYNWLNDTYNSAADWYFETQVYNWNATALPDGSAFDLFEEKNLSTRTKTIATVPMLDWRTKARDSSCSYSVSKYGPQQKVSPDRSNDCGNGLKPDGNTK